MRLVFVQNVKKRFINWENIMSKKFGKSIIAELQRIRYVLDNMENCEDGEEMIFISQELSADIEKMEELVEEKFKL